MHGTIRRHGTGALPRPRSSAVTWIDSERAIIARTMPSGAIDITELDWPMDRTAQANVLVEVADAIGDRERVVITGSAGIRTALERQYVAIYRRPERLVDVEPSTPPTRDELVGRLRELVDVEG
jgi:hypothetical protein